jgi:hypothetical protein
MKFKLALEYVQSLLNIIHLLSLKETLKIKGKYNYHPKNLTWHEIKSCGNKAERILKDLLSDK